MKRKKTIKPRSGAVNLKDVARYVGLTPGTVSSVLNNAPSAKAIPEHTKRRILDAARELNYRPNFFARSLRKKRTYMIGVITEEIGDAYGAMVVSGIEAYLRQRNYFFLTVVHRHDPHLLDQYSSLLLERGVEGLITVDTSIKHAPPVPTVAVAGHRPAPGVTNIVLDHHQAARLALTHLADLGHREIAIVRGQPFSSDSKDRWDSICQVAQEMGIVILPELIVQLDADDPSPLMGYRFTKELLSRTKNFTAIFAYNDITAIGAIRAIQESGLRVPQDISVVGFDDIRDAAYHTPSLTTVRQPLRKMGEIAAQTLLERVEGRKDYPSQIAIEPLLVVRESTGPVSGRGEGLMTAVSGSAPDPAANRQ
jgi:DNA-binding LacI/PurR family transcriptional regulator